MRALCCHCQIAALHHASILIEPCGTLPPLLPPRFLSRANLLPSSLFETQACFKVCELPSFETHHAIIVCVGACLRYVMNPNREMSGHV